MRYIDGYVLPVPKKNVTVDRRMAQKAGKVWRDHGALEYIECVVRQGRGSVRAYLYGPEENS
ncbi:MAG: DUF1428 family protein [Deltaproteobacteria bacterium]|nr:DUF1428 family protein [Deltaproteobacteria bacterium]